MPLTVVMPTQDESGPLLFGGQTDVLGEPVSVTDASLQADVVSPRLTIGEQGLSTYIYNPTYKKTYPYHEKLFLYNFGRKKIYQLNDAATAEHYFQTLSQNHGNVCRGDEFYGAWVF